MDSNSTVRETVTSGTVCSGVEWNCLRLCRRLCTFSCTIQGRTCWFSEAFAVVPDLWSHACSGASTDNQTLSDAIGDSDVTKDFFLSERNFTEAFIAQLLEAVDSDSPTNVSIAPMSVSLNLVRGLFCDLHLLWLGWVILDVVSAILCIYAVKFLKWYLVLPHIAVRVALVAALLILNTLLVIGVATSPGRVPSGWLICTIGYLLAVLYVYIIMTEVKCCQFCKRSSETGRSTSHVHTYHNNRSVDSANGVPVAAPVPRPMSGDASATNGQAQDASFNMGQLPPLRHHFGTAGVGR